MGCTICKVSKRSKIEGKQAEEDYNHQNKISTTESQDQYPLESAKQSLKEKEEEPKTNKNLDQVFTFSYTMTYMQNSSSESSCSSGESENESKEKKKKKKKSRKRKKYKKKKKKKLLTLKERDNSSQFSREKPESSSSGIVEAPNQAFDNFFEREQNGQGLKEESFHSSSNQNSMSRSKNLMEKGTVENKNYSKLRQTDSIQTLNNAHLFQQRKISIASIGLSQNGLSQAKVIKIGGEQKTNLPLKISFNRRLNRARKSILSVNPISKNKIIMNTSGKKISDIIGRKAKRKRTTGRSDYSNFARLSIQGKNDEDSTEKRPVGVTNLRSSGTFRKSILSRLRKSAHQSEKKILVNNQ